MTASLSAEELDRQSLLHPLTMVGDYAAGKGAQTGLLELLEALSHGEPGALRDMGDFHRREGLQVHVWVACAQR